MLSKITNSDDTSLTKLSGSHSQESGPSNVVHNAQASESGSISPAAP